jgi:hypothetical protein
MGAQGAAPTPDLASPPRDELVIKVLVVLRVPGVDVHEVIQVHRRPLSGLSRNGRARLRRRSILRTLTATGASSCTRRALTAATAGALGLLGAVLGLLGAVLGTAVAYLAAIAWFRSSLATTVSHVPGRTWSSSWPACRSPPPSAAGC